MVSLEPIGCRAVIVPTEEQVYPWPHRVRRGDEPPAGIPLRGGMTDLDLGTVVAALCAYNVLGFDDHDRLLPDAAAVVAQAAADPKLIVRGGIEIVDGGRIVLSPGCCCGLEDWREWITFAEGGRPADSGHDPDPLVERLPSGLLRIGYQYAPRDTVEVPAEDLRRALRQVEFDLVAFVDALAVWANRLAPASAAAFVDTVDRAFSLTSSPAK